MEKEGIGIFDGEKWAQYFHPDFYVPEETWSGISRGTPSACRAWFYRCAFR